MDRTEVRQLMMQAVLKANGEARFRAALLADPASKETRR
jgi:hypothetical protein